VSYGGVLPLFSGLEADQENPGRRHGTSRQFYVRAFDASVRHASPVWSSLRIAQVRLTLNARSSETALKTGLHFVVNSLQLASEVIVSAGGVLVTYPTEVQPGVVVADAADTRGNILAGSRCADLCGSTLRR
jgi:predicted enzyme related to lactoylglutathione lyase